jgi:hypothetical protein
MFVTETGVGVNSTTMDCLMSLGDWVQLTGERRKMPQLGKKTVTSSRECLALAT